MYPNFPSWRITNLSPSEKFDCPPIPFGGITTFPDLSTNPSPYFPYSSKDARPSENERHVAFLRLMATFPFLSMNACRPGFLVVDMPEGFTTSPPILTQAKPSEKSRADVNC